MCFAHFAPRRAPTARRLAALLVLGIGLAGPVAAVGGAPDWPAVADVETVRVVNRDDDGGLRDTTVWLVVIDGQGYLRSGGGQWSQNLERDPQLDLVIGETSWPLRAEFVEDDALRQRITEAFREKYGFSDTLISLIRDARPPMMRLLPRD